MLQHYQLILSFMHQTLSTFAHDNIRPVQVTLIKLGISCVYED